MQCAVQLKACHADNFLEQCFLTDSKPKPLASDLGVHEVLVHLKCRPVNPSDVMTLRGKYQDFKPEKWPATPGLEGMGVVEEVGEKVTNVKVGQRVVPLMLHKAYKGNGSWKEYVVVPYADVVPVPDEVSDELAAQFHINPWTVVGLLDELQVPPGEYLLQTAAGSSLGRQLAQYARSQGVRTINVVRREEHRRELKDSGGDEVINSTNEDIVSRVMEITGGQGVYGAVDPVAGKSTRVVGRCVRKGGTVLVYGSLEDEHIIANIEDLIFRRVTFRGFLMPEWVERTHGQPEQKRALAERIMALLAEGRMGPLKVGKKFDLKDFKEAVAHSQEANREGKVFLCGP